MEKQILSFSLCKTSPALWWPPRPPESVPSPPVDQGFWAVGCAPRMDLLPCCANPRPRPTAGTALRLGAVSRAAEPAAFRATVCLVQLTPLLVWHSGPSRDTCSHCTVPYILSLLSEAHGQPRAHGNNNENKISSEIGSQAQTQPGKLWCWVFFSQHLSKHLRGGCQVQTHRESANPGNVQLQNKACTGVKHTDQSVARM